MSTEDNFDLLKIKISFVNAAEQIDRAREPTSELQYLARALADAQLRNRMELQKEFRDFFWEDMGPGLAKRLHKESSHDQNYLFVVAELIQQVVRMFSDDIQKRRFNQTFFSAMTLLFDPQSNIFRFFKIPEKDLQTMRTSKQEWRNHLKENDSVDVYVKADDRSTLHGWMQGKIHNIVADTLFVEFPNSLKAYDTQIDRWSTNLMPVGTYTRAHYDWIETQLLQTKMLECDMHDKCKWYKCTILNILEQNDFGRVIKMANCALRVYRENPRYMSNKDALGTFEGFGERWDEFVPVYSPRLAPWATKVDVNDQLGVTDDVYDDLMVPTDEFSEIFGVPRPNLCTSALYLRLINQFGNLGSFDSILALLNDAEVASKYEGVTVQVMGALAQILTLPCPIFHKKFIQEKGKQIAEVIKQRLLSQSDAAMRDVKKDQIDSIIKSVDSINRRFMSKEERDRDAEIFRLELCSKSLKSQYLDRRIQGIKDLTLLIKNNTLSANSTTFSTDYLIDWMVQNDTLNQIWDSRHTHLQLVQRSADIFKLLLKEGKMDTALLQMFWSLTASEYQSEVVKIVQESSAYLQKPQIEFFLQQVLSSAAEKLSLPEFDLLCDLGKQCKEESSVDQIQMFFWNIIAEPDKYRIDLVERATRKYADLVQKWSVERKQQVINEKIVKLIETSPGTLIPTLNCLTQIIQGSEVGSVDSATTYTYPAQQTVGMYPSVETYPPVYSYVSGPKTATGEPVNITYVNGKMTVTTNATEDIEESINTAQASSDKAGEPQEVEISKNLTMRDVLNQLHQNGFVMTLLQSLSEYCKLVGRGDEHKSQPDPKKLFVASKHFSHTAEVQQRLDFLKFFAKNCDFNYTQDELRVIYDSLSAHSPVQSDGAEFLKWCTTACQDSTSDCQILDLAEVGQLFSDLLSKKILDVQALPVEGFEFMQNYFISVNETRGNIRRVPKKIVSYYYVQEKSTMPEEPEFKVLVNPSELQKLDLVWVVVLQAKNDEVAPRAVQFLINIYMSLSEEMSVHKAQIIDDLIKTCISRLSDPDVLAVEILRIIQVIKCVIEDSERRGTGNIQPHNAILKGDTIDRIIVKNATGQNLPALVVKAYTSATVWEFVDKISRMCEFAPQFVTVRLQNGTEIKEADYGKTIAELGIKNHQVVSVTQPNKELTKTDNLCTLIDPRTNKLTEKAFALFSSWYDKYSDANGVMTPESSVRFIKAATGDDVHPGEDRIVKLFHAYDSNKDGVIEREEFIQFYENASRDSKVTVCQNLHNSRVNTDDLRQFNEMYEELPFAEQDMPRNSLSHNYDQFSVLMNLLQRDDVSSQVWELIRSLATNQKIYKEVLSFDGPIQIDQGAEFWKQFFASGSIYLQSYKNEIIQALMQDSEDLTNRVFFDHFYDKSHAYNAHCIPRVAYQPKSKENQLLKEVWSSKFLQNGGLHYIVSEFLASDQIPADKFKLQQLSFWAIMISEYLPVAIQAKESNNQATMRQMEDSEFVAVAHQSLKLVEQFMQRGTTLTTEEKAIVVECLKIWKSCVFWTPKLFDEFLSSPTVERQVMTGLLYCEEEAVRQSFKSVLSELACKVHHAYGFLLKLLSKNFSQISQYPCNQFFALFNELIDLHFSKVDSNTQEQNLFDAEQLLGLIIDKIRSDNKESKGQKGASDLDEVTAQVAAEERERLIVGLVLLTKKIIEHVDANVSERVINDKDLVSEIFREFLFSSILNVDQGNQQQQSQTMLDIIKSRASRRSGGRGGSTGQVNKAREVSYDLLLGLIKKSPSIMCNFIRDQLLPLLNMIKKPKKWNFQPPKQGGTRSQKYVGLRNLGCICYMNSMMQQFFMIPAFRYNLLCVDDQVPEALAEYRGEQYDDSMLHQMQKLFAALEVSQRSEYNPQGFTFSFKEFDGRPTNVSEQKDAQEFLNVLFDRLEKALKPTSRKYLLESIFQGKQCSQLLCRQCGKVKNRIEDMLNLSLTVKDIKSVYDSLEKQIQGEVISDYQCDGCNKKVDITKRSLIAETPNVLIVHLQRILFNFDSCQNEKENQMFEFPYLLDLKPYSYHEVMKNEKSSKATEEPKDPEYVEPAEEDCFEYKLVGVTVHSGSANAGHYWSYINTARGQEERPGSDPQWAETENDPWMEFNDSTVRDYNFEKLKDECYGDRVEKKVSVNLMSGWSNMDIKYGKSGYMLFYERKVKKPIKLVQPEATPQTTFDAKTSEHIQLVDYRTCVDPQEMPNTLFTHSHEENQKQSVETDVYSEEFFAFVKAILVNVVSLGAHQNSLIEHQMRVEGMRAAKRASFDLLARCLNNGGLREMVTSMIQLFEQDADLVVEFMSDLVTEDACGILFEIILEADDFKTRTESGRLFRYLVCRLRVIERETLLSEQFGNTVSARLMTQLASQLLGTVSRNWKNMTPYLQLFESFAMHTPEQVLEERAEYAADPLSVKTGLGLLLRMNMLEKFLDFILGTKSPFFEQSQNRVQMGSMYKPADFSPLMRVISQAVGSVELISKFPQTEPVKQMLHSGDVLAQVFETNVDNADFADMLAKMCFNELEMTRKVSRIILRAFNDKDDNKISQMLKVLSEFLAIDDGLVSNRLEWVFGLPQIKADSAYRSLKHSYGVQNVQIINDTTCEYKTPLDAFSKQNHTQCLLQKLQMATQFNEEFCVVGLYSLMRICMTNESVARYISALPPHNYQFAHYTDWFRKFLQHQTIEIQKSSHYYSTYQVNRQKNTQLAMELLPEFEAHIAKYREHYDQGIADLAANVEVHKSWMPLNKEVIKHYPPQVIVGEPTYSEKKEIAVFENDAVKVQLLEIECAYVFSNPTGVYNLSLPDKEYRDSNFRRVSYAESQYYDESAGSEVRTMQHDGDTGHILLQLLVKGKLSNQQKVSVKIDATDVTPEGVNIQQMPVNAIKDTLFGYDMRAVAHFLKRDPTRKDWGCNFSLSVTTKSEIQSHYNTAAAITPITEFVGTTVSYGQPHASAELYCKNPACKHLNYEGMDFCEKCGQQLGSSQFDEWGGDAVDDLYTA